MLQRNFSVPLISLIPGDTPVDMQPIRKHHIEFISQSQEPSPQRNLPVSPPPRTVTMRSSRSPDQSPALDGGEREKAKWLKEIQQLQYSPPSESYYDSLPIKPGFFFLESLINAPNAHLSSLKVNLPKTLYCSDTLHLVYTKPHFVTYLKLLEADKPANIKHAFDQVAVVLRMRGGKEADMKKFVFDWLMFRQKMLAHDLKQNSMMQEFIKSPGGKPAVIRLTYYATTKTPRANFAFLISSRIHTAPHSSLLLRTVTDSSRPFAVDLFKQTGLSLKPFESQARNIVDFLQRGYRIRVEEIVLDFIKSVDGTVWLCGCKGFRLDQATIPADIRQVERGREVEEKARVSFVTCKLCRLQFANHELPHLVSAKMLFWFRSHAVKRVKLPIETSHLKVMSTDYLSQTVRICECCFLVVTAEHALIKAERQLALALSIPVKDEDITVPKELSPQNQFLPKALKQHRLLFHFLSLDAGATSHLHSTLFLHFAIVQAAASYALERIEETDSSQCYQINRMRLVYIFSADGKPMKRFMSEAMLEIRVTNDRIPGQGKLIAAGRCPVLQSFPADMPFPQALYVKQCLSLFDPTGKVRYPLEMGIGVSYDHQIDPSLLQVSLTKTMDAYMPDDHYFNADPLPGDWISIFGVEEKEDSFGEDVNPEDAYGPLIDRGDLDRMQDITSPYPAPLSNKLVVSRPKPKKSQSMALIPSKSKKGGALVSVSPQPSDVSHIDRNTDTQIVEVLSLVDNFLRPKSIPPIPKPLDSLERSRAISTLRNMISEPTKRTSSRLRASSSTTRMQSGKSSTRSGTPVGDVKEAMARQYRKIIRITDKELGL